MNTLLRWKKTGSLLLALALMMFFLPMRASALSAVDMSRLGSITIDESSAYTGAGPSPAGMEFTIYEVAKLSSSGEYQLTGDFSASGLRLDQLTTESAVSAASQELITYISANSIHGTSGTTGSSGIVKFEHLQLGYYLVVQADNAASHNYVICDPFMVSVPMKDSDGNKWFYDIIAQAKCEATKGAVILQKLNNSGSVLSGAVFRLERKTYYSDSATMPTRVQTGTDSVGNYFWQTQISEISTNSHGQLKVEGMQFGQYRFIEISAPSGYRLDSTPHLFTISSTGSVATVDGKYVKESGTVQTISVYNNQKRNPPDDSEPPDHSKPPTTSSEPPTSSEVVSEPFVPTAPPVSSEAIEDDQVPKAGFDLPKTGGSICYGVCTYGGEFLVLCGAIVFIFSRKKKE